MQLQNAVSKITHFSLDNLLYGIPGSFDQNRAIFDAVHEFIVSTGRFKD